MSGRPRRHWELGAVERIQKKKRAKNVDRYVRHKQRKNLLEKLEADSEPGVIVASELGVPGMKEEEQEQDILKNALPDAFKKKKKKRNRTKNGGNASAAEKNQDTGAQGTLPESDKETSKEMEIEATPAEDKMADDNAESTATAPGGASSGADGDGWKTVKKKQIPFKKQMKQQEAARLEREKERERFQRETAAHHKRREQSRKNRKQDVSSPPIHASVCVSSLVILITLLTLPSSRLAE